MLLEFNSEARSQKSLRTYPPMSLHLHIYVYVYIRILTHIKRAKGNKEYITMAFYARRDVGRYRFREGWGTKSCGEPRIIGMSGPRDMNQAEQTLNLEIRCRRTKATYCGQRGERTSKYTFAITILDPRDRFSPSFTGGGKRSSPTVTLRPQCRNMHIPNIDSARDRVFAGTSAVA